MAVAVAVAAVAAAAAAPTPAPDPGSGGGFDPGTGSGGGSGSAPVEPRRKACGNDRIHRHGSWRTGALSEGARGGKYCDNLGTGAGKDRLRLAFTGPRLKLTYGKARAGGAAKIVIDGERVGTISFGGTSRKPSFGNCQGVRRSRRR